MDKYRIGSIPQAKYEQTSPSQPGPRKYCAFGEGLPYWSEDGLTTDILLLRTDTVVRSYRKEKRTRFITSMLTYFLNTL